ncbi:MAG: sigma factor-like helix-turn-helix DNA-binding protein, partial [Planctomycetota bacterium]
ALGPWLARVTRNFARKDWRGEKRRHERERVVARPEGQPAVDEALVRLEEERKLVDALATLEPAVREVVVRRYLDGWSCARIARASGAPAATVRWRLQKGLAELRAKLDRDAGGDGVQWRLALLPLCDGGGPWPAFDNWLQPLAGAATVSGVLTMKAATQALGVTLVMAAAGIGVWWAMGRGEERRSVPAEAQAELAQAELEPAKVPEPIATAPSTAPSERAELVTSAKQDEPASVSAAPIEARIEGRCVDGALLPLAGVRVLRADEPSTRTDTGGDGRFSMVAGPSRYDGTCELRFELEGKATRFLAVTLQDATTKELGDVVLEPGGVLRGVVLGPTGRPFPEAEISVTTPELWGSLEEAESRGPTQAYRLSSTSGGDGRFEVRGVPLTPVRAWAVAPEMRHAVSPPLEEADRDEDVVLTLEPLRRVDRITGIVLTPEGEPVANAGLGVLAWSGGGMSSNNASAGPDGRFEIEAQPGNAYDLEAVDPLDRYASVGIKGLEPGAHDVELRFRPAFMIAVEVRSVDGEAIERFCVATGEPDSEPNLYRRGGPDTHPDGRAEVRANGNEFVVRVDARGYAPARQGPFAPDAPPEALTFELEPAPGVRGRVLAGETPLAGAKVELFAASPGTYVAAQGFESAQDNRATDATTSDAEGNFVLQLYERDTFVVRAEADGFAPQDSGPVELDPALGHELELVLGPGGSVEGRVLMPPGRDPEGVIVGLNRGDSRPRTVRADAEGRFRFERLTPGSWQLARAKQEFNPAQRGGAYSARNGWTLPTNCAVRAGETTRMDLDLSDWLPGELDGRLTVNGAPAEDWLVQAWPKGVRSFSGTLPSTALDADGRFHLALDEPGPRRLSFSPAPELGLEGVIELEAEVQGGPNTWSHDLAFGELYGHCPPIASGDTLVLCNREGSSPSFFLTIAPDSNDRYRLPYVPAGPAEVRRYSQREGQPSSEVLGELVVRAGAEQRLDVP